MYSPKEHRPLAGVANIIAVAAGKGGVGKSSVTVNLAHALKNSGFSVGVLDADVYGPSIRRMLPEEQMPTQKNERFYPALSSGIKTMSISFFRRDNESTAVRAPVANGIITQFLSQVEWGVLDYLLIDFPPGTGDIQLTLAQKGQILGALMVTTPQEVALMDVRKAAHMFEQVNIPILGIVENMSYYRQTNDGEVAYIFGRGGGERLASELGVPFLGEIPIDPEICRCGDEGKALSKKGEEQTIGAMAFAELAKSLVAHTMSMKRSRSDSLGSFNIEWKDMS
jgi:ATP-binding protein involved in chromosome partitioning